MRPFLETFRKLSGDCPDIYEKLFNSDGGTLTVAIPLRDEQVEEGGLVHNLVTHALDQI